MRSIHLIQRSARAIIPILLIAGAFPRAALAVTPDELVALHREGLGESILLALIDSTGVQGTIDGPHAVELKREGLGERVISAAIRRAAKDAEDAGAVPTDSGLPWDAVQVSESAPEVAPAPLTETIVLVPWPVIVQPPQHRPTRPPKPTLGDYRGPGRFINSDLRPLNDGFVGAPRVDR
jgi:hypothetical protein